MVELRCRPNLLRLSSNSKRMRDLRSSQPHALSRQPSSHGIGVDVKCGKWRWFLLTAHWSHKEEHEREQHSRSFVPQRYQWVDTHRASRWHPAGEKTDQQEQHNNREERQRIVRRNSPELIGQYSGDRKAGG